MIERDKDWIRIRTLMGIAASVIAVAAMTAPAEAQRSISCSSDNGKRHYCNVETRGGVSMQRQRSDAACEEGYSWGYDRRGIWVDHGCRADFKVDSVDSALAAPPERLTLTCSSSDGKRHFCQADTLQGVRLFHKLSDTRCTEGYSWGFDRHGVWVDHGCRAEFRLHQGMR
jgi:hypothetical protein